MKYAVIGLTMAFLSFYGWMTYRQEKIMRNLASYLQHVADMEGNLSAYLVGEKIKLNVKYKGKCYALETGSKAKEVPCK